MFQNGSGLYDWLIYGHVTCLPESSANRRFERREDPGDANKFPQFLATSLNRGSTVVVSRRRRDPGNEIAVVGVVPGGGGGGTPYNGLYGDERGTSFRLEVYKRVGISRIEV